MNESLRRKGRIKPYTNRGIKQVPCCRCGKPSTFQWNVCSDDNRNQGVCLECDIELNRMVLEFMGFPDAEEKVQRYVERLRTLGYAVKEV